MSGPKAADVQLKLARLVECCQREATEVQATAARYQQLGTAEAKTSRQAVQGFRDLARASVSDVMQKFAPEESSALNGLIANLNEQLAQADAIYQNAENSRCEAERLQQDAKAQLKRAHEIAVQVGNTVANAGFFKNIAGFETEDKLANSARSMIDNVGQLQRQSSDRLRTAADQLRASRNAYDVATASGQRLQKEIQRISHLAAERQRIGEISENNRRQATTARQEAASLTSRMEALNHDKFAPGKYAEFKDDLNRLESAFLKADYPTVNQLADVCLGRVRSLTDQVAKSQTAWETAHAAAANDLQMARKEFASVERSHLTQWSGEANAVNNTFEKFDAAQSAFASEDFAETQKLLGEAREAFRRLCDQAGDNKVKFDQRQVISDAIMNALYEQGYDAPSFYFAKEVAAGQANQLSDLTIFAKSPGNNGDMRMKVKLDGHVDLEVENIPVGQEGRCVSIINDLQERLAGDVDFQMTDWGRGENHRESIVSVKDREKTQEKTRERHRE